jgi:hypothetical protein
MTKQIMAIFRRSVRRSRGKPGQFGCLLGLATSILIDGHVIRIDCVSRTHLLLHLLTKLQS